MMKTLITVPGSISYQYNRFSKKFNYEFDVPLTDKNYKIAFKEHIFQFPGYGFEAGISSKEWWGQLVKKVIRLNAVEEEHKQLISEHDQDKLASHLYDQFVNASCWEKYDDCDLILDKLRSSRITVGIISNFDERLPLVLKNLHLENKFDFFVIPSNCKGFYKPCTEVFQRAMKLSKCTEPGSMLHIGDDVEVDYKAAKRQAHRSILLKHDLTDAKYDTLQEKGVDTGYITTTLKQTLDKILEIQRESNT